MHKILIKVSSNEKLKRILTLLSYAIVAVSVASFLLVAALNFVKSLTDGIIICTCSMAAFIIVTIVRRLINRKRPYEVYDFYKAVPKEKFGRSFPSRHVFSIFLIAALSLSVHPLFCAVLFFLGLCLAAFRVLLGIHFVSDVIVGALLGFFGGICPLILMHLL